MSDIVESLFSGLIVVTICVGVFAISSLSYCYYKDVYASGDIIVKEGCVSAVSEEWVRYSSVTTLTFDDNSQLLVTRMTSLHGTNYYDLIGKYVVVEYRETPSGRCRIMSIKACN